MNDVGWRIRLLVMESDLNRIRLKDELLKFRHDIQTVARQATGITALTGLGMKLLTAMVRPGKTPSETKECPATWLRLLISASTAVTSWYSSSRRP
jgi:hypothetical protein